MAITRSSAWRGQLLSPGRCLLLVAASWALTVLPLVAFTSLAILFSVATRSGIAGVIGPAIVALLTQLLGLVGTGVWAHMLLIGSTFDLWHGLFPARPFYGPLVVAGVVAALWTVACLAAAWELLRRRDFAGADFAPRASWVRPLRLALIAVAVVALLAVAGNWGPVGVTATRLQASLTPEFSNISLLQQRLLGRTVPVGAKLDVVPYCNRHAGPRKGPGDWSCTLNVFIPTARQGSVSGDPGHLRRERPGQRLLQGSVASVVRWPADDQRCQRQERRQSAVRGLRVLGPTVSGGPPAAAATRRRAGTGRW